MGIYGSRDCDEKFVAAGWTGDGTADGAAGGSVGGADELMLDVMEESWVTTWSIRSPSCVTQVESC